MQLIDDHKGGHQAAAEKHGKYHDPHIDFFTPKLGRRLGQRIGHKYGKHHIQGYADEHPFQRYAEGGPELGFLQHVLIGGKREIHRPQLHQPHRRARPVTEGNGNGVQYGDEADDPAEKQEKINQDIGKLKFLFLHTSPPKTHDNPQIYPPAYRTPPAGQSLSGI